ncbi:MGMT family protein [Niallia nealsonii]|uniref:DNA methyltransferase n=1 Tax=Niallia nealsonii TaxID=115979 RepID=A0A2N0YW72_9BACI|nr:MGMT family protein [Niallia nealsonii]PKG21505.1 DNA methyltransferase [Niallia nealsonii]
MQPFTLNVIKIIQSIPRGKVMTYGQIAKAAGSNRAARQVVRILHSMSEKYQLPWHRVVNASGKLTIPTEEGKVLQKQLLQNEGIVFEKDDQLSLKRYMYDPIEFWEE